MYCKPTDHWSACAKRVKDTIRGTNDPAVALAAAIDWSERYRALYVANARDSWSPDDQTRLESALEGLWDEGVGKYLDPSTIAWEMLLARHAKTLSAMLELLRAPGAIFFYALLAPSPIANDFTAAKPENEEIARLLFTRFPVSVQNTLKLHYTPYANDAYKSCTGNVLPLLAP